MPSGRPELIAGISEEIRSSGPMSFARFMELALYHPRLGYYTTGAADGPRIGWNGDFYTSPEVHPVFARAVARQVVEMDALLGHPAPFTLVEMGPGTGAFMRDLLEALRRIDDSMAARLRVILIERSPALRDVQTGRLETLPGFRSQVRWVESLDDVEPASVTGLVFSNELVDAFPVHRVTIGGGALKEIYVDWHEGGFRERRGEPSTPALQAYLDRIGVRLAENQVAEINLAALEWMRGVAALLARGFVLTVDYGHTARDLYDRARTRGTLLCYAAHRVYDAPYERIGEQDMTAHVDFTSLALEGREAGLELTGFTNQASFLMGTGIDRDFQQVDPDSPHGRGAITLLQPHGMGGTFKVLVQHKGVSRPALAGLRYRAFVKTALNAGDGDRAVTRTHG